MADLPEWLIDSVARDENLYPGLVVFRLATALLLGSVVAGIYRVTHGQRNGQTAGLQATLVLLTVLIGVLTLVIGNSVARAFSLVGSLAIVRFRTVVEDTRDTAFVIFAVAIGMAIGSGFLIVPLVALPFGALAAVLFRPRPAPAQNPLHYNLTVRMGTGYNPDTVFADVFGKHLEHSRLTATSTVRQGAALDVVYLVRLRSDETALSLVAALNKLEGVQSVEIKAEG